MAYPDKIDRFADKLNKKQDGSIYVIEEELQMVKGVYEGFLAHDNANNKTIKVYTGPRFTGEEITSFLVSIPAETPWRRMVKIFAEASKVYVTYETPGDVVEAGDINSLQESVTAAQREIERYKAEGIIDGGYFTDRSDV